MWSSDEHAPSPLTIVSDIDVRVTLYDRNGARLEERHGGLVVSVPRGIYRVKLERAGRSESLLFEHDRATTLRPPAPELRTPAPLAGAATSYESYQQAARDFSTTTTAPGLGQGARNGHLLIFIRREARELGPPSVPSEPISVLDLNGRVLATLDDERVHQNKDDGFLAYSAKVAPGIYRIRAQRSRRDIAIAIPPDRSAYVFLADIGAVRLDDPRIFLPRIGGEFEARCPMGRGIEAVLEALKVPHATLPASVLPLLTHDCDLYLAIAAAHLLLRGNDASARQVLDDLMPRLAPYADHVPDVAILLHVWRRRRGEAVPPLRLLAPPMLRASFLFAMASNEVTARVPEHSALAQSADTGYHDSVVWSWSYRAWDARWVSSTIDDHLARGGSRDLASLARTIALPVDTVERAIRHIDATIPAIDSAVAGKKPVIPGYDIREVLGRGSQGTVYRATRNSDFQSVAIKVLPFAQNQRAAALREIKAMEPVDHPNLLSLATSGSLEDDSGIWLEVELCRGSVLDRLAELDAPMSGEDADRLPLPDGAMSVEEACRIVCEALEGLEYLHARHIVHRDIKPANLLIRMNGRVAVADFGLIKPSTFRRAGPRGPGGTARFAPREQLVDADAAAAASDVWSMAATLYFMLTLEHPRDEYADQSELEAARNNPVIPIRQRRPDLPAALAEVIDTALSAKVFRRPDARSFRDQLISATRSSRTPRRRALVIDAYINRPTGPESNADLIASFLKRRDFHVDLHTGSQATTEAVRKGFDRLVTDTLEDDSVVLYYSGHAFTFSDEPSPIGASFSLASFDQSGADLLALPLSPLVARTDDITIITDACLLQDGTLSTSSPSIVQIAGCGNSGVAIEYRNDEGTRRGVFTEALVEILDAVGELPFSWEAIGRAIRARVIERFPTQEPLFLGPSTRQPFSRATGDDRGVHGIRRDGEHYVVAGGEITGAAVGDRFAVMPAGSFSYDATASLGELEIIEVLPASARARLVALPEGSVAIPITRFGAKRPVAIDLRRVSPRFLEAIAAASTLRLARPGERPIATIRARDGELSIEDDVGPLCAPGELGQLFGPVIRHLSRLAAAQTLRELAGEEHGISIDEVELVLGIPVDGKLRPLPARRALLGLADRVCVSVANRSSRTLFAHVFAIGARGDISLLSSSTPEGIEIAPSTPPHLLSGLERSWPSGLPGNAPRFEDIVVIVTAKPIRLDRLATHEARANLRSVDNSALQDLFDQVHDGQLRELRGERVDEFFVGRLPLLLAPLPAPLASLAFELEDPPLERVVARALTAPRTAARPASSAEAHIAIRLADCAARSAIRIDAIVCTQSDDGKPSTWTARFSGSASAAMQIFAGAVRNFVDIAIFVSEAPGTDGPALSELLDGGPDDAALEEARAALRHDDAASQVALAVSASAVFTCRARDALRSVALTLHCLYRSSFLADERFGAGRHPAANAYHGKSLSFCLEIEKIATPAESSGGLA